MRLRFEYDVNYYVANIDRKDAGLEANNMTGGAQGRRSCTMELIKQIRLQNFADTNVMSLRKFH